jgi:hypothetical protein
MRMTTPLLATVISEGEAVTLILGLSAWTAYTVPSPQLLCKDAPPYRGYAFYFHHLAISNQRIKAPYTAFSPVEFPPGLALCLYTP